MTLLASVFSITDYNVKNFCRCIYRKQGHKLGNSVFYNHLRQSILRNALHFKFSNLNNYVNYVTHYCYYWRKYPHTLSHAQMINKNQFLVFFFQLTRQKNKTRKTQDWISPTNFIKYLSSSMLEINKEMILFSFQQQKHQAFSHVLMLLVDRREINEDGKEEQKRGA